MQDQIETRLNELKAMSGRSAEQDAELSDLEKQLEFLSAGQASQAQPDQPAQDQVQSTDANSPETTQPVDESAPAPTQDNVDAQTVQPVDQPADSQTQEEPQPQANPLDTQWHEPTAQEQTAEQTQAEPQVEGQPTPEANSTMVTSYTTQDEQPQTDQPTDPNTVVDQPVEQTQQEEVQPQVNDHSGEQAVYGNPDEPQQVHKEGLKQRLRDLIAEFMKVLEAL